MKTILVDDEPIALEVLENMLEPYEDIDIIGSYTNPADALKSIEVEKPDIIFLDIEMGDLNGLGIAEILMRELEEVEIVFVTAFSQYAIDAFEINAIDYLLKPIQENRLSKSIERLRENFQESKVRINKKDTLNNLRVNSFGGFQVLDNMGNTLTWRTQKSKELFAYLCMKKERPVPKSIIMEAVFPGRDPDKASTLLHTTIYQVRKNLGKLGYSNAVIYLDESYQINIPVESDIERLNRIINLKKLNDEDIREVLEIYKGELLEEGYYWGIEVQQRYRTLVLKTLESFSKKQIEEKRFNLILKMSLDKAYSIDPYNSTIAEMMLHYYGAQSEMPNMEIFFNEYSERLRDEMDLEVTEDIRSIYRKYMKKINK